MNILAIFLMALFAAIITGAQAQDDCFVELDKLESQLGDSDTSITTIQPPGIDPATRGLSHVIELASGARVEFSAGGCVHYGFSYTFSRLKQMPAGRDRTLFDFIRTQVKLLPLQADDADFLSRMLDTLQQASVKPDNWMTPTELLSAFGDANVYLSLYEDGFKILYDFPL